MRCPRCQHENRQGRRFCSECGASLALACTACGFSNEPGEKFCGGCGQPFTAAQSAAKFASPESYTPKHLAERILTSKTALEGERKQVTVLFADMKASMELLADRDPEEARGILDPILEFMMEAVHRFEGTVNQVMGDGIMALFGAPLAHEDHAVRACYAALRMQESVKRYADGVRREHGATVRIRVGLNSGEVVVRAIKSDLQMDYTAVGQMTHLAARMEQLAEPGTILLSPATLRLAEGYVEVKALGPVPVKGMSVPVETYEIVQVSTVRSRFQARAAKGFTRFVGREDELDQLRKALFRASRGHGELVAVVGDAGVGKSRLCWEFTHSRYAQGWLVLESGSASYGKATPYLPIVDMLRTYFRIADKDDARTIEERVTGKVLSLDRQLEPSLPALLSLLDVPIKDSEWNRLEPPQRRLLTLDGLKRLLLRESQLQPVIMLLEDLHWIDTETQTFLDGLVESLPTARLLLLVNHRPEYRHSWGDKRYYSQLGIEPLLPESAERLLENLLGSDPSFESIRRALIERTEGNPLFLEESVRTLVETGILVGQRGTYRLAKSVDTVQVPATVQAILAARIDRLPPEEKSLLQTAAVIGKDVPYTLLGHVAGLPEETLRRHLFHLVSAEFLYEAALFPDIEYAFKHTLTQETAYAGLLHERRRTLHGRICEAMTTLSPGVSVQHIDRVAHHAFRGELWTQAIAYLSQAGERAVAVSAYRQGLAAFENALAALRHLPVTSDTRAQEVDLHFSIRTALRTIGEVQRSGEHLRAAEALANALGDRRRLATARVLLCNHVWLTGDVKAALAIGRNALDLSEALGDVSLQIVGKKNLGLASHTAGDYIEAGAFLRDAIRGAGQGVDHSPLWGIGFPEAVARSYLGMSLAECGAFPEGFAFAREALQYAEAREHPYSIAEAAAFLGFCCAIQGDFREAALLFGRCLEITSKVGLGFMSAVITATLGHARALSGQIDEGIGLALEGLRSTELTGGRAFHTKLVINLGEVWLVAGRTGDAMETAQRALDLARQRHQRGFEGYALHLLGSVTCQSNCSEPAPAESLYFESLALAEPRLMRPLMAHCHRGLGKLYRRTGKRQEAQEHLTTATTMYREMEMRFWLEQAEAEQREATLPQ